jgi:dUTP pyrophosphatase
VSVISSVKFVRMRPDATVPTRATPGSAAFDLYAAADGAFLNESHTRTIIPTGFGIELLPNYCALVCSRSGLANDRGWFVLNSPGVIDSDYRGEIKVILGYLPSNIAWPDVADTRIIRAGDRIAQLLIMPLANLEVSVVESFQSETLRAAGGFGSTGII